MGGAAVLYALAEGLGARCAVISSAFARVEALTDYVLRKRLLPPPLFRRVVKVVWSVRLRRDLNELEPERTVRGLAVPLLLTHGTLDPSIPFREIARLAAAAGPRARALEIEGAAHTDLTEFPPYREGVLAFLEEHLAGSGGGLSGPPPRLRASARAEGGIAKD
jgi:fermentation-respiration switch protein FrsA (DUF1100 family)